MITTTTIIAFLVGVVVGVGAMRYTILVTWEGEGE